MANDYIKNQAPDTADTSNDNSMTLLPESPDTPAWGPPAGLPESPDTPVWGPPVGLPESPDTPAWGPPPGFGGAVDNRPIITFPGISFRPNVNTGRTSSVRFLHAAVGQGQVSVSVNNSLITSYLIYSNMTEYQAVTGGYATVTVRSSATGRIVNQTNFVLDDGAIYTIALINSADGVALYLMEDVSCRKSVYNSCIRVANLTNRSPAVDVMMTNGRTLFNNVRFLDVTGYRQFNPGTYSLTVTTSGGCGVYTANVIGGPGRVMQLVPVIVGVGGFNCARDVLVTGNLEVAQNRVYTLYLIGNAFSNPQMQMLLAESYFEY